MVGINLDGFSLANRLQFAKLSRYTVYVYVQYANMSTNLLLIM